MVFDCREWPRAPSTYYLPVTMAEEMLGGLDLDIAEGVGSYDPAREVVVYVLGNDGSLEDWLWLEVGLGRG